MMIDINDIKNGMTIILEGQLYQTITISTTILQYEKLCQSPLHMSWEYMS